jgi:hypothetical protein
MDICLVLLQLTKCGYSSKVQVKYMHSFLLQILMFQLSSALNPASRTDASLDLFEASEVHCAPRPRYICLIPCIETRCVVVH